MVGVHAAEFLDGPGHALLGHDVLEVGEALEHAAHPFFTTKNDVGSGLGLSTVDGLVGGWGGKLEIASIKDRGTTVVVVLPISN
ncbi:MAG: ATP-binding protein [Acidimicrobiales bacterium]